MFSTIYMLRHMITVLAERLRRKFNSYEMEQFDIHAETPIRTFYEGPVFDPLGIRPGLIAKSGIPSSGLHPESESIPKDIILGKNITLILNPKRSYFGDALNVVDVPNEARVDPRFPPFGWSGDSLIGGYALTVSPLKGQVVLEFQSKIEDGFIPFTLHHSIGLKGQNSVLSSPDGYRMPSTGNTVVDARPLSHGYLEISTGRLYDFHYNVRFFNSAIVNLLSVNPGLGTPPLLFPGVPQAGHVIGKLQYDSTQNQFSLRIHALMFLPLDIESKGKPITMPAAHSSKRYSEKFLARNSSLHPFISIDAIRSNTNFPNPKFHIGQQTSKFQRYENRVITLTCLPIFTNYGDLFRFNNSVLAGQTLGKSPLFGNIKIQFGSIAQSFLPYTISFHAASNKFEQKLSKLLALLPPGSQAGLIGMRGHLDFPSYRYLQSNLSLNSDPQKISVGVINLEEAEYRHELVLRKFLFLNLMEKLIAAEPRTPTDSFAYLTTASFSQTQDNYLVYNASGKVHIPYPDGYRFPLPNGKAIDIYGNSHLKPFVKLCAVETDAFSEVYDMGSNLVSNRIIRGSASQIEIDHKPDTQDKQINWQIVVDGKKYIGISYNPAKKLERFDDDCTFLAAEIEITHPKKEQAYLFISKQNEKVNVLCFSTLENLDFWMES